MFNGVSQNETTVEKIGRHVELIDLTVKNIHENLLTLQTVKDNLYEEVSHILDSFDDVNVERLRTIRPKIEQVVQDRENLFNAILYVEDLYKVAQTTLEDIKDLSDYYYNHYLESVEKRQNRNRKYREL